MNKAYDFRIRSSPTVVSVRQYVNNQRCLIRCFMTCISSLPTIGIKGKLTINAKVKPSYDLGKVIRIDWSSIIYQYMYTIYPSFIIIYQFMYTIFPSSIIFYQYMYTIYPSSMIIYQYMYTIYPSSIIIYQYMYTIYPSSIIIYQYRYTIYPSSIIIYQYMYTILLTFNYNSKSILP